MTRAGLYCADGTLRKEAVGPPCNPVEYGVDACVSILASIAGDLASGDVKGLTAGISGSKQLRIRDEIARAVCVRLRTEFAAITDDLHPLLYANAGKDDAVLVIAGTGSSVLAQAADGRSTIVGGRGRLFGDEGSAYQIAASASRAASYAIDGMGPETRLVAALPRAAGVETFPELVSWSAAATKQQIAALASVVSVLAEDGDAVAQACIACQAERLASQTLAAFHALELPKSAACFVNGGVFAHSAPFLETFSRALSEHWNCVEPSFPSLSGHRAAFAMAMNPGNLPEWASVCHGESSTAGCGREKPVFLERMKPIDIVRKMNSEDETLAAAVARKAPEIARTIAIAVDAFAQGGRLIYVGAGTSGRLGVLDASECPPTFGVSREKVIGIIAGGPRALVESVEGAEDDIEQAVKDLKGLSPAVSSNDVVVAIAASGRTPYTLSALRYARESGAATVLLCCSPMPDSPADVTIDIVTGVEVLPGSTRLKAGTATKMALNMISTGSLALAGHVYGGRMTGVRPTNYKLRKRAVGIIHDLTQAPLSEAERALDEADGSVPVAMIMIRKEIDAKHAASLLEAAKGRLHDALDAD